jgi:hypothetical protein
MFVYNIEICVLTCSILNHLQAIILREDIKQLYTVVVKNIALKVARVAKVARVDKVARVARVARVA